MAQGIKALKRLAASTDEQVRLQAVKGLYESRDIRAMATLKQLASQDGSVRVRYMAKKAMFLLRKMMEVELLDEPSLSGDVSMHEVKQQADEAVLRKSGANDTHITINLPKYKASYCQAAPEKKVEYIQAAVRYNSNELLPFFSEQVNVEKDVHVRATLAISIGILGGEQEVPAVASFLKDPDPRVRANAIEGLDYIGVPRVYPIIMRFLSDPDNRIRGNVVKALKNYGKVNLTKLLSQMLSSDKPWMRDSAAYCLSVVAAESFLPLMIKGMQDQDREVRRKIRTAVERLAAKGSEDAAKLLTKFSDQTMVFHSDFDVENPFSEAALAAAQERETGKSPLFSDDVAERKSEIDRIVADKDVSQVHNLIKRIPKEYEPFIKACMVTALGRLGDMAARELLVECLGDEVARVRANAVEALSTLAPDELVSRSKTILYDENNRVRANAINALIDLRREESMASLDEMVHHEDELYRRSAFWAITDIADSRIVGFMKAFLADESEEIKTRAVHFIHQLKEVDGLLADEIMDNLDGPTRKLLVGPMTTKQVLDAFEDELPLSGEGPIESHLDEQSATDFLGVDDDEMKVGHDWQGDDDEEGDDEFGPPGVKRFKYDAFKNLSKDRKLDVVDEAKSVINVSNFYFLREVMQKEKDFVVKVAARRALKSFENQDFAQDRLVSEGDEPDFLKTPEIQAISYRGIKTVLQLSQDLVVRGKKREVTGAWFGPFGEAFQCLNALREDSQDMLSEIIGDEEVIRVSLCYYNERLRPFLDGERSLDMNRYANIVSIAGVANRLDLYSPSRPFLNAIKNPVYMLVVLTAQRCILYLRGPIEDRQARYRELYYRQITKLETKRERELRSIEMAVGPDLIEIPELRADESEKIYEILKRESIDKIKSEERFIDIDFTTELKKLEMLHKGNVISDAEYKYRRERLLKMDSEKFSEKNVQRILTRRYKDDRLAARMDDQLMNRFRTELTIMFTDIVGYSKKTSAKQILDLLTILAIHDSLLLPKIRLHNGTLIKKMGDALMVSFKDPENSIRCARDMQKALIEFNEKNEDEILIRIGVNTGDVFVKDGDIFGKAVNNAAAMENFCQPGEIFISHSTYEQIKDRFACNKKGPRTLKDGAEMIVYSVT